MAEQSEAPNKAPLEFVVFYEQNYKCSYKNLYIFYLQWTGNEKPLKALNKILSQANYEEMSGDYSYVHMDLSVKIPESAVDYHCMLRSDCLGAGRELFNKLTGKFTMDPEYSFGDLLGTRSPVESLDR